MKFAPPTFENLNDYYKSYWKYLKDDDILEALKSQGDKTMDWLSSIEADKENYAYLEGKWMVKEVIGHLCDTERILAYRALRFSRNDKTPLTLFDENSFIKESNFRNRSLKNICDEWKTIRAATISLFNSMTDEIADRIGIVNGVRVSPRIVLYFILVHERHHLQVIKDKYF